MSKVAEYFLNLEECNGDTFGGDYSWDGPEDDGREDGRD
jgi:hypothetical protein